MRLGGIDHCVDDHGRISIAGGHGRGLARPRWRIWEAFRVGCGLLWCGYRPQCRSQDLDRVVSPEISGDGGGVAHPALVLGTVITQLPAVRCTGPSGVGRTQVVGLRPTFVGKTRQHRLLIAVAEDQRGSRCRSAVGPRTASLVRWHRRSSRRLMGRDRFTRDARSAHLLCWHERHAKAQRWNSASTRPRRHPQPVPRPAPRPPGNADGPALQPGAEPAGSPRLRCRSGTQPSVVIHRRAEVNPKPPAWSGSRLTTLARHGRSPRATPPQQP